MSTRTTLLAVACAMALAACGDKSPGATDDVSTASAIELSADATSANVDRPDSSPAPITPKSGKPAAVVTECATEIEGTDAMQYNVGSITVPASCIEFKITLRHTGTMPVAAMGHNVVISRTADMQQVASAGISAGLGNNYVKPADPNVIAYTKMIGGGETTSVSFPVSKIQGGGPYEFFCSFPGHSAIMKGTISVEQGS